MKIASSSLQWQTQHSASRLEVQSTRVQMTRNAPAAQPPSVDQARRQAQQGLQQQQTQTLQAMGERQVAAFESLALNAQRTTIGLQAGRQSQGGAQLNAGAAATQDVDSLERAENGHYLRLIADLLQRMFGIEMHGLRVFEMPESSDVPSFEDLMQRFGGGAQGSGWRVSEVEHYHLLEESEVSSWATQGVVRTADGQEIRFSLDLQMERHWREESHTLIRMPEPNATDPLVINFDGTAAQLQDRTFAFDLNGDGVKEQVPLLAGLRGFLALDRNGNNQIDDGRELFGPNTGNGYAELAAYDEDGNGWIDENDAIYDQLRVWIPQADGPGRLMTLKEADVGALSLKAADTPFALRGSDNQSLGQIRATSAYLRESGGAGHMQQIDLSV